MVYPQTEYHYHKIGDLYYEFSILESQFPGFISHDEIGRSTNGNPIYLFKVGNPYRTNGVLTFEVSHLNIAGTLKVFLNGYEIYVNPAPAASWITISVPVFGACFKQYPQQNRLTFKNLSTTEYCLIRSILLTMDGQSLITGGAENSGQVLVDVYDMDTQGEFVVNFNGTDIYVCPENLTNNNSYTKGLGITIPSSLIAANNTITFKNPKGSAVYLHNFQVVINGSIEYQYGVMGSVPNSDRILLQNSYIPFTFDVITAGVVRLDPSGEMSYTNSFASSLAVNPRRTLFQTEHANEHPGPECMLMFSQWLLRRKDPFGRVLSSDDLALATRFMSNLNQFIPIVNPDCFGTEAPYQYLDRPCNAAYGNIGVRLKTNGVNLDRNFPAGWVWSSSGNYNGASPGSEPETKAVVNNVFKNATRSPRYFLDIHSGLCGAPKFLKARASYSGFTMPTVDVNYLNALAATIRNVANPRLAAYKMYTYPCTLTSTTASLGYGGTQGISGNPSDSAYAYSHAFGYLAELYGVPCCGRYTTQATCEAAGYCSWSSGACHDVIGANNPNPYALITVCFNAFLGFAIAFNNELLKV